MNWLGRFIESFRRRRAARTNKFLTLEETVASLRRHSPLAIVSPLVPTAVLVVSWWLAEAGFYRWWWIVGVIALAVGVQLAGRIPGLRALGGPWRVGVFALACLAAAQFVSVYDDLGRRVLLVVVLASAVRALIETVEFLMVRIYLTDRRILRVEDWIISSRAATLPLRMLTDVSFTVTWLGNLGKYGHFSVESAGQDQALSTLRFVQQPWKFYQTIMALAPPAVPVDPVLVQVDPETRRLADQWEIADRLPV